MMSVFKKYQQGLLLIEVLLSLLIFSFGILGLVGLQAVAVQNSSNALDRATAANLAGEIVSQMWLRKTNIPSDANLSADIITWKLRVTNSSLPNASGDVQIDGNGVATITVTWKAPQKKSSENSNRFVTQVTM